MLKTVKPHNDKAVTGSNDTASPHPLISLRQQQLQPRWQSPALISKILHTRLLRIPGSLCAITVFLHHACMLSYQALSRFHIAFCRSLGAALSLSAHYWQGKNDSNERNSDAESKK